MGIQTVTVQEACAHFAEVLARAQKGEEVVIAEDAKPVARVVPKKRFRKVHRARNGSRKPIVLGLSKGQAWTSDDFDEPLLW